MAIRAAFADPPVKYNTWERYVRLPELDEGHYQAITNGTTGAVLNDTGTYTDERDLLFLEWGTAVVISECAATTCFCATLDDDVTIGSGSTCGDMADTGTPPDTTGGNACVTVAAGSRVEFIFGRARWDGLGAVSATSKSGYRNGYCTNTTGTTGYPCDDDDDCLTSAGAAGTCSCDNGGTACTEASTATHWNSVLGGFLVHETAAGSNTSCHIRKDL